jgi:hypothetical protein
VTQRKPSDSTVKATEEWADGDAGVKDALMEGAAEEQRAKGMLPTPQDNEALITDILGTFDRKGGAQKTETPPTKKPTAVEKEFQRRCGRELHPDWLTVRGEAETVPFETPIVQKGDTVRDIGGERVRARLALLRSKPGWMERIKDAVARYSGKERLKRLAVIVEESNKHFGHWAKPPAKPLWFS